MLCLRGIYEVLSFKDLRKAPPLNLLSKQGFWLLFILLEDGLHHPYPGILGSWSVGLVQRARSRGHPCKDGQRRALAPPQDRAQDRAASGLNAWSFFNSRLQFHLSCVWVLSVSVVNAPILSCFEISAEDTALFCIPRLESLRRHRVGATGK